MRWSRRRAEPGDAEAICAVVEAGFETYRSFAPAGWSPPAEDRELLRGQIGSHVSEVAEAGGAVVGVVHAIPGAGRPSADGWEPDVHLRYLFVAEPFWGTGLASELHDRVTGASLRLYTPTQQARARRFYERRGWMATAEVEFSDFGLPLTEYRLTSQ